jgi:hypothetical protein
MSFLTQKEIPFVLRKEVPMRKISILFVVVVCASALVAQDSNSSNGAQQGNSKPAKGQITVQGCVGRSSGDYVLSKQDPGVTYELQVAGKIKLSRYLGQRVEVTGKEMPSIGTSSDALAPGGSPAPVTLTVTSIKTIAKECTLHQVSSQ